MKPLFRLSPYPKFHTLLRDLVALILGGLTVLIFAPFNQSWLVFITITLLIWLLKTYDWRQAARFGLWWGLGFFGLGASWIYVSIATYGNVSWAMAGVITAFFVVYLASFISIFSAIFVRFFLKFNPFISYVIFFPVLWVCFEWLRGWMFTGFPWLYLGYSQFATPISGFVPVIGVLGASYVILVLCGALVYLFERKLRLTLRLTTFLLITITLLGLGILLKGHNWVSPGSHAYSVALIQPNISQKIKWNPTYRPAILDLYYSETQKQFGKDIIIWPENALPMFKHDANQYLRALNNQISKYRTAIILGIPIQGNDPSIYFNGIFVMGQGYGEYHKRHLVPFGEYVPFTNVLGKILNWFDLPMTNFSSGEYKQRPLKVKNLTIAPAICYEIAYIDTIRKAAKEADMLLTISNDTWFGRSIGPFQHLQIAQMRALETGRPVLRGTNNGITAIINHKGEIEKKLEQFKQATLEATVYPTAGNTPFVEYGWWFNLLILMSAGFLFIFLSARTKLLD